MTEPTTPDVPDVNAAIAAQGSEFTIAMDLPRIWANGAQVFVTPDTSMLIFREQNAVQTEDGVLSLAVKNVSSLIMPTQVLRDLYRIFGEQLAVIDGTSAE